MFGSHLGEVLAVASAVSWGAAMVLFRVSGQKVVPLGLNLFKTVFGLALFVVTLVVLGVPLIQSAPAGDYALLLASGLLGIAFSDTLLFYSLNLLGAGPAAIVATLYSPFVIGLSLTFLGEHLSFLQAFGVGLIVTAVLIIAYHREERRVGVGSAVLGITLGVLAQLATAVGIVMIKPILGHTHVIWATAVRLTGAVPALALFVGLHGERKAITSSMVKRSHWRFLVPASFLGTYISIVAWMAAMKYTDASVAAALSQMSTAFTFIFAALFLKEKPTPAKLVAVVLALAGALLASSH